MKRFLIATLLLISIALIAIPADGATLTTEIARVREMVYSTDSANSVYTDTLITEAIQSGQELLGNLLSYSANYENVLTAQCAYTTGSVSITSPTGMKKVIEIFDVATLKPYIQIKPEEAHRLYSATTKDPMFMINGGTIKFYPAATAPGTLEVNFLKAYTPLSSGSDTISVQTRYLNLLTLASAMLILTWDNQSARAGALKQSLTDQITIENQQMMNSNVIEKASGGVK